MKYLICSDIHGSLSACRKAVSFFEEMKCGRMIILGDTLYHGPRNPLPEGHNPKEVANLLNNMKDKIIACRGNCDAEVDQNVLEFETMADYISLSDGSLTLLCTHGHIFSPYKNGRPVAEPAARPAENLLHRPGVIFFGHTHISLLETAENGIVICNPGSVSLPKGGTSAGFATFENGHTALFDMDGRLLKEL